MWLQRLDVELRDIELIRPRFGSPYSSALGAAVPGPSPLPGSAWRSTVSRRRYVGLQRQAGWRSSGRRQPRTVKRGWGWGMGKAGRSGRPVDQSADPPFPPHARAPRASQPQGMRRGAGTAHSGTFWRFSLLRQFYQFIHRAHRTAQRS